MLVQSLRAQLSLHLLKVKLPEKGIKAYQCAKQEEFSIPNKGYLFHINIFDFPLSAEAASMSVTPGMKIAKVYKKVTLCILAYVPLCDSKSSKNDKNEVIPTTIAHTSTAVR